MSDLRRKRAWSGRSIEKSQFVTNARALPPGLATVTLTVLRKIRNDGFTLILHKLLVNSRNIRKVYLPEN